MRINQLLRELKQQRIHIAIVINEHGSFTGLVTLEDVLEEIVGEISDEYEAVTEKIVQLEPYNWLVDAIVDLETLSELLNIDFEAEDIVTLGGFLTEKLQHLPKKGERVTFKGYIFQVQKASPKRVSQVLIFKDTSQ
jgi:CBS domain containing-hemolysin-like protein